MAGIEVENGKITHIIVVVAVLRFLYSNNKVLQVGTRN
jgi:hypothetical protein